MTNNTFSAFNAERSVFRLKNKEIFDSLDKPKTYEKNQVIYMQGDDAGHVYYLMSGKVQIYVGSPSGLERILVSFEGGSLFGKSAFFDNLPRASCARALKKSEIILIDKLMMKNIIGNEPQFALDMLEYLSKTIRLFSNYIENISFLQADKRIAIYIIDNAKNNCVTCTHDEISDTIGASRVTVSKILSRFAESDWIETRYKVIHIKNIAALTAFAFEG
ncbi:MAG: Crp/Fnr family transcriptional regulator [Defluviitaleaceae bacterium]|nr:Crp/Fnr family transcriptional regulator [Defluviitaleaceae bacterium]